MPIKLLECYPFLRHRFWPVKLVWGYEAYDGVLKDEPGKAHKGIDYVRRDWFGRHLSFDVFAAHSGETFQGFSESWGNFVTVREERWPFRYDTYYCHLNPERINPDIPPIVDEESRRTPHGLIVLAGDWLARAGRTGDTKGIVQLHFELHQKNFETEERFKLDPYGLYARASSGFYPQPGQSLAGLAHWWVNDRPPFAKARR